MSEILSAQAISEGIMHGPFPAAPEELLEKYIIERNEHGFDAELSETQLIADIQSEWQYDQHCEAVENALNDGRINQEQALYFTDTVLRPYWIGHRKASDK